LKPKTKNIIFDFGGVLIHWDPRLLYREYFRDKQAMEYFLREICTSAWNHRQDEGQSLREGTEELVLQYPGFEEPIRMFYDQWIKMIGGEILENTRLIPDLKAKYGLFGLTNWSAETLPLVRDKHDFFDQMEGIVVSGEEKAAKPDPVLYRTLLQRYSLQAEECLFIDDTQINTKSAQDLGFQTLHYAAGLNLEVALKERGIL
jgi:2-haloacid dehalogenase